MTVRLKLALTVVAAGLVTAAMVIATVFVAFDRFERVNEYQRAAAFLERVAMTYDSLLEEHERAPQRLRTLMRNLVLYEPDIQLYLLDAGGRVLSSSTDIEAGYAVPLAPVQQATRALADRTPMPYVMGQDPQRMDADAVIAARALRRALIRNDEPVSGYLYVVNSKGAPQASRWQTLRSSFAMPVMVSIAGIVAAITLLAALVISAVTRPLARLTDAVANLSQQGLDAGVTSTTQQQLPAPGRDEFGRLNAAFALLLQTLRRQWDALRQLDRFRREGVSNLSHDLRSPLTASVACLETLEGRWGDDPARTEDRRLVQMALRNTRNAARLVQSLGDLATLDEPEFKLRTELVDAGELLEDIAQRFAGRAAAQGVALSAAPPAPAAAPPRAALDVELFERAVANLVDNALKHSGAGTAVTLAAIVHDGWLEVSVSDTGPGIAAADLPHLFDRFYQSRRGVAPATGVGGKGLGLAIVKRIAELHGGQAMVESTVGTGTRVLLRLPAAR
jgi:signal transduction histidine kinase